MNIGVKNPSPIENLNYIIKKKKFFDDQWWEQTIKYDNVTSFIEAVGALVESPVTFSVSVYPK